MCWPSQSPQPGPHSNWRNLFRHEYWKLCAFTTIIKHQSCLDHNLVSDEMTKEWLRKNVPEILEKSLVSKITLPHALTIFAKWVESCRKSGELAQGHKYADFSHLMIWSNPSKADSVWIRSAYSACKIDLPWKHYNDLCVRSFIKQCESITGKNFERDET